jgi:hypothetical protein
MNDLVDRLAVAAALGPFEEAPAATTPPASPAQSQLF